MSKMEATRKWIRIRLEEKKKTHHVTFCIEQRSQTDVEFGKRTGGTNTSRFWSSTGAVATREKRDTIENNVVVNFIVN
jgi:hypothetical protein